MSKGRPSPGGSVIQIQDFSGEIARLSAALRDRDERLRLAEVSAGVGVWDIDVTTDTVRGTEQFFRIMGLQPVDAPVPMDVLRSLRLPEDRERVNQGWREAVGANSDVYDSEYRIRRRDGEVRWIFGRGRVVRDASGRPIRYSGVDLDITDRKAAEGALAESETRLRLAVEAAGLGIWDWNPLTNEMKWSSIAKAIAGFPLDQPVTYEQVRALTHPEDLPRTAAMVQRAIDPAVRAREPYEYRIVCPDGEVRWVLAHGEARFQLFDGIERAYRYTGTIQDITEQKLADQALQASEARLRLAVDAARLAIWQYDATDDRPSGTPDLNRMLGFPQDAPLEADEIRARFHPGDRDRLLEAARAAQQRGDRYFQAEFRFHRPDGKLIWLLLRAEVSGPTAAPSSSLGVLMDITDLKTADKQRKTILAELQHRVRNTLALVGAMASQTFRDPASRDALLSFSERLSALGKAHAVLAEENWQSADCREVVESSLAPYRTKSDQFEISGPPLRLSARQALSLALAINELATNAAKYGALSVAEGRVAITWGVGATGLVLRWREAGGPLVRAPSRTGFGTRIIREHLASEFSGIVTLEYAASGLDCTLTAPWPTPA